MFLRTADGIRYYQFAALDHPDVTHAVFARHGGVSVGQYTSLNMSVSTGDSRDNVRQNRTRAFQVLDRDPASVADLWQVHSAEVVVADTPNGGRDHWGKADALITDRPDVTLFLRFADCVPILLFDARRQAVGIVHAGWKGTLLRASSSAVRAMTHHYASRPQDIVAGIGPSIGPCHYQVGPEVVEQTRATFNSASDDLLVPAARSNSSYAPEVIYHLDLWAANALDLRQAGVEQIETSALCSACHPEEFFSHRADQGKTGRFGALIGLR